MANLKFLIVHVSILHAIILLSIIAILSLSKTSNLFSSARIIFLHPFAQNILFSKLYSLLLLVTL